jgi:oligopeptide/dipeptide ABC transporter ATP-binding protein
MPLLEIKDLRTYFHVEEGVVRAVDGVSFSIGEQETFGLVGESGCGKSVTAFTVLKLIPMPPARIESGEIVFDGKNLVTLDEDAMRQVRGNSIGMVFQEPMTALNPVMKVGAQIIESLLIHSDISRSDAVVKGIELLKKVGIPLPEKRFHNYPFELSGGMKQRVMIASALACGPKLLIADEPTTALDVTIQAQIIDLLKQLQDELKMSVLLITHNLGLVAENSKNIAVMYAGRIVEKGPTSMILADPRHPYTKGLLQAVPDISKNDRRLYTIPGTVPSLIDAPRACRFAPRCPWKKEICTRLDPDLMRVGEGHEAACFLYGEVAR